MLSVIVPVYNEALLISKNMPKLKQTLDSFGHDYELIIAEDGSSDDSVSIAEKFVSKNIKLLTSKKRLGRGLALRNAIMASKGEIIVYMDADLATDLKHLPQLIEEIKKGFHISTGSRLISGSDVYGRTFLREIFSRWYNIILRLLFKTSIHDHQCGFKAFRKSTILPLLEEVQDNHWFWDTELLIRAQSKDFKVSEVPVKWTDKKNSTVSLVSDIFSMGLAVLKLRLSL